MTAAIVVQVTDQPVDGEPKSSTGTILIQSSHAGGMPVSKGCGSLSR